MAEVDEDMNEETIKLRHWLESDIDTLVKYANNPNIARFMRDAFPHPYTKKDARAFIKLANADEPTKIFAMVVDQKAVGSIGIFPKDDVYRKNAEIGYWLAEEYWGRGITTFAVKAIIQYGFRTWDLHRIFASVFDGNLASQKVLAKAGMKMEARFRNSVYKNEKFLDEIFFSIRRV